MKYTILHISDIHKSKDISYDALLQSLKTDYDRYTVKEGIESPSFIVVSGDLIEGAYDTEEIRNQYKEVEYFLDKLCTLILNGDKERIIIVPGNHDVNRPTSIKSMIQATTDTKSCLESCFSEGSKIRWNWKELAFYEISDQSRYISRFTEFIEFYNRFYSGIRSYPVDPEREAYICTFKDFKVSFIGFNSCHDLDHLRDTGKIAEEALISIGQELNDSYNAGCLNIAVWHHHIYGRPLETNYMDRSILTDFISNNIHIGLYGHQHFSQIAEEYTDLLLKNENNDQRLLLVSSGTLFGGNKQLPPGCRRQYNIIEIQHENGKASIDINVREDKKINNSSKIPFWIAKALHNETNKINYQVELKKISLADMLLQIDRKVKMDGDYQYAYEQICMIEQEHHKDLSKIKKTYLRNVTDPDFILNANHAISSVEDAIMVIEAARASEDIVQKIRILENEEIRRFQSDTNVGYFLEDLEKDLQAIIKKS